MAEGRVLVVEDDSAVAGVICDIISSEGLECLAVRTDREAYKLIPTLPAIVALVLDINLGAGTSGFDVARFARQIVPGVPVLYVSGEITRDSFTAFGVPDSVFVAKPFAAEDILAPLRERLAAR